MNRCRRNRPIARTKPRLAGRTSLTPARAAFAFAGTILALLMVPIRGIVEGTSHD